MSDIESKLDPKGLGAAREAWIASDVATRFFSDIEHCALEAAIRAYITTLAPADNGLVAELRALGGCSGVIEDADRELAHRAADTITAQAAEIERLKTERKAIRDKIPMNYLQRHDAAGVTGPSENLDLVSAVKDFSDDRWKLIDRVRDAESRLSALQALLDKAVWQPIETAPKDGTIIVWSPMYGGKVFFAKWDDNQYARKPRPYWSFSDERMWGTIRVRDHQPTHWMALPAAPTAIKEARHAGE